MLKLPVYLLFALALLHSAVFSQNLSLTIPLGGNSWVTTHSKQGDEEVTDNGWSDWTETDTVFSTFVYLNRSGTLRIAAEMLGAGRSALRWSVSGVWKTIVIAGPKKKYDIGEFAIGKPGYVRIDVSGISRSGGVFATIKDLIISGSAVDTKAAFVKNNEGNFFLWGRRGPSVHLRYDTSKVTSNIEWFYSEITVPKGNDVIGSYFQADGFNNGYFGMQVNSSTERRVLFSVWSPFQTDDPRNIPENKKIKLLRKGTDVATAEFGNEGSGGQSYLRYNWKPGTAYGFLLRAQPVKNNFTNYSAWFYAPDEKRWIFIASFSRPETSSYLEDLYSFLENFEPDQGYITRSAWYHDQWVRTTAQKWVPITQASFTYDDTASKGYRLDYSGGTGSGGFYLRNCGFFNGGTKLDSVFTHPVPPSPPDVNLANFK